MLPTERLKRLGSCRWTRPASSINRKVPTGFTSESGARWVARYLLPLMARYLGATGARRLACLQIAPDDEKEAIRLRQEGHRCDVVHCASDPRLAIDWLQAPITADPTRLPLVSSSYDLIFCGDFGRLTVTPERRWAMAVELARVCRAGGAVLLAVGNRRCPIDLSRNTGLVHGPRDPSTLTLEEMERLFVRESGFAGMRRLSLAGHFGWASFPRPLRGGAAVDSYLRWVSGPERPGLYASPLNPLFMLWLER